MPTKAERNIYQSLIHQLAHTYHAPVFIPHVTIYSGLFAPEASPEHLLAKAVVNMPPFAMQVVGLHGADIFTKSLFIQLQPSPCLQTISDALRAQTLTTSDYELDPHLSLMYQLVSESEKQQIIASIELPNSRITFDEVSVISAPTPTRTPADVARWKEVCRRKLPGAMP